MGRSQASLVHLIEEHVGRHPAMTPRDVYKLLYQGVLGLEHLVTSPDEFAARLRAEHEAVSFEDVEVLWETVRLDGTLGRLNLRPFKVRGGDIDLLIAVCLQTAERSWGTPEELRTVWASFVELCRAGQWQAFPFPEVLAFSSWLENHGYPAAHHSAQYREAHRPAYRLLSREFLSDDMLLSD